MDNSGNSELLEKTEMVGSTVAGLRKSLKAMQDGAPLLVKKGQQLFVCQVQLADDLEYVEMDGREEVEVRENTF
jgi:hypothetical protein